ncbi:carbonyl reductase [Lophiostoma macrostomum CBS 122681]|uniref:Carbonyl reductase n=1 Tax=Lophiostoma macrostomum CBS 122681 TaxID=1314788 RepID=A0A6A6TQP0_9PLEO|nr:carbonyl reductase [Lophiostoma macrostomum CBS 122681]
MSSPKQIVLITGANRGIGFSIARFLARDHSFHVLLGSRDAQRGSTAAETLRSEGLSVEPLTIDITDDSSIAAAATSVSEKHGHIDVLVNNAGVLKDFEIVDDIRLRFSETFNINVFGGVSVLEAFLPLLSKATVPRVVFITSKLGSITDRSDPKSEYEHVPCAAYRASKTAVNMVVAHYSSVYRDKGWKINTVCPGSVKTEINNWTGKLTVEEAMPVIVKACTLGADGDTGTFNDPFGPVDW